VARVLLCGKGLEGVRVQLGKMLKPESEGGPSGRERTSALGALHTLFHQIASHPEEIKFRRIRRDHPGFLEDIGKHDGGEGVLIAAGFRYGVVDEIKCLVSREPDLESDMDGWSEWFGIMKGTVEILEEEMIKG